MAVLLAALSAALFGAMTVAIRFALRRGSDAELGALVTVAVALAVAAVAAALRPGAVNTAGLAVFLAAGLVAPGGSQLLFTKGVRDAGSSRASVVVGTAPLVAVVIAVVVLHEPLEAALVVGALLIVLGGIALVAERGRPLEVKTIGLVYTFACTALFAARDNFVRWYSDETVLAPGAAAATTLLGGAIVVLAYLLVTRRGRLGLTRRTTVPFVSAGLLFGLSYIALFEAYFRGRVSVVSPIVATETLWGVTLSALLIGGAERVGPRLAAGAVLIVAGGVLIGAFR